MATGPQISDHGPWTLAVKIGLPFACLGALLFIAGCVWMTLGSLHADDSGYSGVWSARRIYRTWVWAPYLLLILFVLGMVWAYYPANAAYHQYRQVDGTVSSVSSRIVSAGDGGSNQKFVVTLAGSPQQFAVNDTRAALLKPGDHLTISCKKTFVYGGTDGFDCNWGRP